MTPIKLIISDLDGTLLNSEGTISRSNIAALQAAMTAGVRVVLASARVRVSMAKFATQIGTDAPMICCDGAQVYQIPNGPLWQQSSVPHDIALEIMKLADLHNFELITTAGEATCYLKKDDQPLGEFAPGRITIAHNVDGLGYGAISRIVIYDSVGREMVYQHCQSYADKIRVHQFALPGVPPHSLGIFAPNADKGDALRFLMQQLNLQPEQVVAIGDNFNDLPMFEAAGVSIAMGNAADEIKQEVDHVAPDNDHDGVAWAVQQIVLD